MKTALLFCKKDFAHSKPWLIGAWVTIGLGNLRNFILPDGDYEMPWLVIGWLAPAVVVYLTCIRIVSSDPFVGTSGFIDTRPVLSRQLLKYKLAFIAITLFLPAMAFAFLTPVLLRVHLSLGDGLLFLAENSVMFWCVAGVAVLASVITRKIGAMTAVSVVLIVLIGWLARYYNTRSLVFSSSFEEIHLQSSAQLAVQALLPVCALATAATWVVRKRIWQTAAVFLICALLLASLKTVWRWNFVDALSKDVAISEIITGDPGLVWQDQGSYGSNNTRDGIRYSQVTRSGRIDDLEDGWLGKLVKFDSEARFQNGAVWRSIGTPGSFSFGENYGSSFLPRLGIERAEKSPLPIRNFPSRWTLFECEKSRLTEVSDHRAAITGSGKFKLYQPYVVAHLPAKSGATAVSGRFRLRIESLSFVDGRISVSLGIRGLSLKSRGREDALELLLVNPVTQEFGQTNGSSGVGNLELGRSEVNQDFSLTNRDGTVKNPDVQRFLKDARLYILGTRYGGNLTIPYEIPEIMLEEKQ